MGGKKAALIRGDFYARGGPDVRVMDVSNENYDEKVRFERETLEKWLE
jgi:hypothetical protein